MALARCGDVPRFVSFADALAAWAAGQLPVEFAIEDAAAWDGATAYLVSDGALAGTAIGEPCDPPL